MKIKFNNSLCLNPFFICISLVFNLSEIQLVLFNVVHDFVVITIDDRSPNSVQQLEFSLRFPHNSTFFVTLSLPSPSVVPNQSSVPTFNATLSSLLDALLN